MNLRTAGVLLLNSLLWAQSPMTLQDAVSAAVTNYPAVRVAAEQMEAASAAIELARAAYLPRADVLAQLNRATRNNVFGLLLPQSTLPNISGPPKPENDLTNVWGSAIGFLVSWEPFDFGLRRSRIETAVAGRSRADAAVTRTRFEVAAMVADAYLTAVAAGQTLKAAQAQRERSQTVQTLVTALVNAELRPGADLSRSRADVAATEAQVIQAEQARRVAEITLAQLTGATAPLVEERLLTAEPTVMAASEEVSDPYLLEQRAVVTEAAARRKELDKAWYPRFALQGSSYARGTGANPDGTTGGTLAGIGPNIQNWAVGMTVSFPVLELPSLRARKEIERHRYQSEIARERQIAIDVRARIEKAAAALDAAQRLAKETPIQLDAAQAAERQARARYEAGLATLVELADAQRLLTQAEIDQSLAHLNIWRAVLNVAVASGNLQPFLELTR